MKEPFIYEELFVETEPKSSVVVSPLPPEPPVPPEPDPPRYSTRSIFHPDFVTE